VVAHGAAAAGRFARVSVIQMGAFRRVLILPPPCALRKSTVGGAPSHPSVQRLILSRSHAGRARRPRQRCDNSRIEMKGENLETAALGSQ